MPGELVPAVLRLEDKFPFPLENLSVGYLAAGLEARGIAAHIVDGYAERLNPEGTARRVLATRCAARLSIRYRSVLARRLGKPLRTASRVKRSSGALPAAWAGSSGPLDISRRRVDPVAGLRVPQRFARELEQDSVVGHALAQPEERVGLDPCVPPEGRLGRLRDRELGIEHPGLVEQRGFLEEAL